MNATGVSPVSDATGVAPGSGPANNDLGAEGGTSCLPSVLQAPRTPDDSPTTQMTAADSISADQPSQAAALPAISKPTSSVFSRSESAPVHNVPMRVIHRPLPSELDEAKVEAFMREMQAGDSFTPIELAKVKAPLRSDPNGQAQVFYFAMGGCHRYEATKRLGWETIRARIIDVPASQMRIYLGAGSPF